MQNTTGDQAGAWLELRKITKPTLAHQSEGRKVYLNLHKPNEGVNEELQFGASLDSNKDSSKLSSRGFQQKIQDLIPMYNSDPREKKPIFLTFQDI